MTRFKSDHFWFLVAFLLLPVMSSASFAATGRDHHTPLAIPLAWNIGGPLLMLLLPCSDKVYGNGRPWYWVRQSVLAASSIISLILVIL